MKPRPGIQDPPILDHRDDARCGSCGGKCCRIYLPENHGGVMPSGQFLICGFDGFEEYAEWFHRKSVSYGVEALFDPLRDGGRHIPADGSCQYRGPSGCIIPRERRPEQCLVYRCDAWEHEGEGNGPGTAQAG